MRRPLVPGLRIHGDPQDDEFAVALRQVAAVNKVLAQVPPRIEQARVVCHECVDVEWTVVHVVDYVLQ